MVSPQPVSLEKDLELIMEMSAPSVPSPTQSPGAPGNVSGVNTRKRKSEELSDLEAMLVRIDDGHAAAMKGHADAVTLRDRLDADVRKQSAEVREATAAFECARMRIPLAAEISQKADEELRWFDDVHAHFDKARTKGCFEGKVKEEFAVAAESVRRAWEFQQARVNETMKSLQQAQKESAEALRHRDDQQAEAQKAAQGLEAAEETVFSLKHRAETLASQATQLRDLLVLQQQAQVVQARMHEAAKFHLESCADLEACEKWAEDLSGFFEGRGVKDGDAIAHGLEAAMPQGDMLPVIVRAMLNSNQSAAKVTGSTAASLRELVLGQLRELTAKCGKVRAERHAVWAECERVATEAAQRVRQQREHLEASFAAASVPRQQLRNRNGGSAQAGLPSVRQLEKPPGGARIQRTSWANGTTAAPKSSVTIG